MKLPLLTIISKSPNKHYVGLIEWARDKEFAGKGKPRKFPTEEEPFINGRATITQITKSVGRLQALALLYRFQEGDWAKMSDLRIFSSDTLPTRIHEAVDNWIKEQEK